jgi:hypothetical protein
LYRNYKEYITAFINKGGVIEAMPECKPDTITAFSVFFNLEPNGDT